MDDSRAQEKILDITLDVRVTSRKVGTEDSEGGVTITKNMGEKKTEKTSKIRNSGRMRKEKI